MKILLINPNTSQHVTERMRATAQQAIGDAAAIQAFTAQSGPAIISSRSENAIALAEMLRLAAAHQEGHDVLMLGVSIDTGLQALREMLDIPVVGMAEAALLTASMLGGKIGCLTLGAAMVPVYEELTASYGLASRVSKWRAIEVPSAFKVTDADPEVERALIQASKQLVHQDGSDVIVLCGAVLAGYARQVSTAVGVPVVDPAQAAALQALTLARMRPAKQSGGSFARPKGRLFSGIDPSIAALYK
jgi:allantoin racemase